MVIFELRIDHFGKLQNKTIPLRQGMNVITGDNESGKTTIANFILSMIYGMDSESETYVKYLPYDSDGCFGGAMRVLQDGTFYWVERSFIKNAQTLSVTKASDGYAVPDPEEWMERLHLEVSEQEYRESGFSTPDGLKLDEEKWSASEDKNARHLEEREIRNHQRRAYEKLSEERDEVSRKINPDLMNAILKLKDRRAEEEKEKVALETVSKEKKQQWTNEKSALEKLINIVNERNTTVRERLRLAMVEKKQFLESFGTDLTKKAEKSNFLGTFLLVLSILAAIVAYFLKCSNKWPLDFKQSNLLRTGLLLGIPVLLFLVGLILSIVTVNIRSRAAKKLKRLHFAREEAEEAEKEYQDYLNHRAEREEHIERQEERTADVEKLAAEYESLVQKIKEKEEIISGLRKEEAELTVKNDEQVKLSEELDAINLAMEMMSRAGKLSETTELNEVSVKATRYLNQMNAGSGDQIEIANDMILVSSRGIEKPLSGLSTTKTLGVLLSVRLAMFDAVDSKKILPIIFDNVLNNFDAERLNAGMNILRSSGRQVILLSSQNRERKSL